MHVKRITGLRRPATLVIAALLIAPVAHAAPSDPQRVSVGSDGEQADGHSFDPGVSNDGRFIAFESNATNLVAHDTNGDMDIFLYDMRKDRTLRVSESSSGGQGNRGSDDAVVSGDGRFVAFETDATNLSVKLDKNKEPDVYVHNIRTGQTNRVSINSDGKQANSYSFDPDISDNGRYVAFFSHATNLSVKPDRNGANDVFVYDRRTRITHSVSVNAKGEMGNGDSYQPVLSGNGRYVAYTSRSRNLVAKDRNNAADVFVYDRDKRNVTRVSVSSSGQQANDVSRSPAISADGRYVAFVSSATNLVENDSNAAEDVFVHDLRTGRTTVVSVSSEGEMGNDDVVTEDQHAIGISPNGALVTFVSAASNLVPNDTNNAPDTFVYNLRTGEMIRAGRESINADVTNGMVVFDSSAMDEVALDTNNAFDVFAVRL